MRWIENLNVPLFVPFIKSFLCVTENDCEIYNPPNYGYAAMIIIAAPASPSCLSLHCITKTHKSQKHPWNTMHWGIPLNYPYTSQIQIPPDLSVSRSLARVS